MQSVELPHDLASASRLRREVVEDLRDRAVPDDTVDDVALVLTELVSNAVRHGAPLTGGTLEASWHVGARSVHVEVRDAGDGPPGSDDGAVRLTEPDQDATGGRGLVIVEAMARTWGVRTSRDGAAVWAELARATVSTPVAV